MIATDTSAAVIAAVSALIVLVVAALTMRGQNQTAKAVAQAEVAKAQAQSAEEHGLVARDKASSVEGRTEELRHQVDQAAKGGGQYESLLIRYQTQVDQYLMAMETNTSLLARAAHALEVCEQEREGLTEMIERNMNKIAMLERDLGIVERALHEMSPQLVAAPQEREP